MEESFVDKLISFFAMRQGKFTEIFLPKDDLLLLFREHVEQELPEGDERQAE
jgi:hypothetical protein